MKTQPVAFALRELRARFTRPVVAASMAGIALVLGVSGPFNTLAAMPLGGRIAYWATVVVTTYATGFIVSHLVRPALRHLPAVPRVGLTALAITCAVVPVLLLLNLAIGQSAETITDVTGGFLAVLAISLAIEAVGIVAALDKGQTQTPAILDRLPLDKRGGLIALSVRDHYVDVITTRGRAMLLMRLGDAIRETQGVAGLQVHRSHWVARDHIAKVRRQGDTATLTLRDNTEIPVSRSGLKVVQEAGLLPARGAS